MDYSRNTDLLRIYKKNILFNSREIKAIDSFCRKYGIANRSKFMREAIIETILKKLDEDYPRLF
jgi:ATP-dependent helicase/DNAse subunit B